MNSKLNLIPQLAIAAVFYTFSASAHQVDLKGSIPLSNVKNGSIDSAAKISITEAIQAASKGSTGKVIEAMLGPDHGYLTYTVVLAAPDKTINVFTVDAGNAQVLSKRAEKMSGEHECSEGKDHDHE